VEVLNADNMPKTKLSDILKNGENFKLRDLDPNDPEIIAMIDACVEEQQKSLERKKVNWNKLRNTVIDF
jgi:hypothetical protein